MNSETAAGFFPKSTAAWPNTRGSSIKATPARWRFSSERCLSQIMKTPSSYFAVLGKAAEPLPKLQSTALAGQLSPEPTSNYGHHQSGHQRTPGQNRLLRARAMGGKTTNLDQGPRPRADRCRNKGKLVSLATSSDRTLFFDFLPIEAVAIKGFKTKFQLYTVPGQVIYNTTRQLVLRGVDGIVFVADSQYDKMAENVESFGNLEENLESVEAQPGRHPLRPPVQQARPARRGAGGVHGISAE